MYKVSTVPEAAFIMHLLDICLRVYIHIYMRAYVYYIRAYVYAYIIYIYIYTHIYYTYIILIFMQTRTHT